jgi:hypothetical protein
MGVVEQPMALGLPAARQIEGGVLDLRGAACALERTALVRARLCSRVDASDAGPNGGASETQYGRTWPAAASGGDHGTNEKDIDARDGCCAVPPP